MENEARAPHATSTRPHRELEPRTQTTSFFFLFVLIFFLLSVSRCFSFPTNAALFSVPSSCTLFFASSLHYATLTFAELGFVPVLFYASFQQIPRFMLMDCVDFLCILELDV